MICPFCKYEIPDNTKFCPNCGLIAVQQPEQSGTFSSFWNSVMNEAVKDNKTRLDAENKIISEWQKERHAFIGCLVVVVVVVLLTGYVKFIRPEQQYRFASELLTVGKYEDAIAIYQNISSYKDSEAKIQECKVALFEPKYQSALELLYNAKYEEAKLSFDSLGDYKDSSEKALEIEHYLNPITLNDVADYNSNNKVRVCEENGDFNVDVNGKSYYGATLFDASLHARYSFDLGGQFSFMNGVAFIPLIAHEGKHEWIKIYGDKTLLWSKDNITNTDLPIPFAIDLSGVNTMLIETGNNGTFNCGYLILANTTLYYETSIGDVEPSSITSDLTNND